MRRWLAGTAALLLVAAAVFAVPTLWGKPFLIEHFYIRAFADLVLDRPMLLSRLRILEPWGFDFHSDELDDFSPEFAEETARKVRENLETLRSYDVESQTPEQRLSSEVMEWFLANLAEAELLDEVEWVAVMPPDKTSFVQPDLPPTLEAWLDQVPIDQVEIEALDFDVATGYDALVDLYRQGQDPEMTANLMLFGYELFPDAVEAQLVKAAATRRKATGFAGARDRTSPLRGLTRR